MLIVDHDEIHVAPPRTPAPSPSYSPSCCLTWTDYRAGAGLFVCNWPAATTGPTTAVRSCDPPADSFFTSGQQLLLAKTAVSSCDPQGCLLLEKGRGHYGKLAGQVQKKIVGTFHDFTFMFQFQNVKFTL